MAKTNFKAAKPGKQSKPKNGKGAQTPSDEKVKKTSKSALFWQEQTKRANEKREKKRKEELEFETVSTEFIPQQVQELSDIDKFNSSSEDETAAQNHSSDDSDSMSLSDLQDDGNLFEDDSGSDGELLEDEIRQTAKKLQDANRKGKKSGGFQSMGLSYPLFKAIKHKGYKIPTPIQRKAIPVIQNGGDVVAMARTGNQNFNIR
jgi:ATP-dependent RNA helicase DDX54/DBP10